MFKLSAILLVLAAGVVNAVPAAPAPSQDVPNAAGHVTPGLDAYKSGKTDGLVALATPGVFICINAQFVEPCAHIVNIVPGQCYNLAGSIYFNSISSLGPDRGLKCYGYLNSDCAPAHPNLGPINYPGIASPDQFVQDGVNYHDHVNSIKCWKS